MKTTSMMMTMMALLLAAAPVLAAVDTTKVYNSGILVILFLGVCALIVLVQLMPALMMLAGTLKGMLRGHARNSAAAVAARK